MIYRLLASLSLVLLVCLCVTTGTVAAQAPQKEYAATYHEPFKGPPKKAEDFTLIGSDAAKCVKFEPEGLRITMPAGRTRTPTGVATRFGLKGDFEITVRYEILKEPPPEDAGSIGVGTRISLRVNLIWPEVSEASIRRKVALFQPIHIKTFRYLRQAGDREPDKVEHEFPVKEKTGRFRLVRTGANIAYYLAEGRDEKFVLLRTYSYGADDVKDVWIYGQSSSDKAVLDARFTDLHIGAAALPRLAAPPEIEKGSDPAIPTKNYAQTYFQSFKGSSARPAGWEFTAPPAEEWVHFEPAGLRLTMPAGHPGERRSAGIQSAFGVKGDFEITLQFEFFNEAAPIGGGKFATRLLLGAALDTPLLDTPNKEAATLNRSLSIKGDRSFTTWMRTRERPQGVLGGRPTTGTTGRLRLVRSGADLSFLVSTGADQPFTLVQKRRFGAADLKRVSISGATGGEKAMLDVRLTDFSIRADAIPGAPSAEQTAKPAPIAETPREGGMVWWIVGLLVVLAIALLLVLTLGARFLVRDRRGAAKHVPSDAIPTVVSVVCPHCEKALKVKPELAGKKVRCGRCGKAVLVSAR